MIPKIIHQTAKSIHIPQKWAILQQKVKKNFPEWEYRFWTDEDNLHLVQNYFREWEAVYLAMPKAIMRVDMIRYMYMYEFGGLYLDIDYEILRPFNFQNYSLVLPSEHKNQDSVFIGNSIFSSVPRHAFWAKVLNDLKENPPLIVKNEEDVINLTGPGFLTKTYLNYFKDDTSIYVPERNLFNPNIPRSKFEQKKLENDGITIGIHHCRGSWRDTVVFHKRIINKLMDILKIINN